MNPVTLTVSGNQCTMSNGILSLSWKEDGTLGSLSRNGVELVCNTPERSLIRTPPGTLPSNTTLFSCKERADIILM